MTNDRSDSKAREKLKTELKDIQENTLMSYKKALDSLIILLERQVERLKHKEAEILSAEIRHVSNLLLQREHELAAIENIIRLWEQFEISTAKEQLCQEPWREMDAAPIDGTEVLLRCSWKTPEGDSYKKVHIGSYHQDYLRWYEYDTFLTNPDGWLPKPPVD
jgi:hypothetical protein